MTDPTSGFQALNRRAIGLYAADYPHDYPEVEGLVMAIRHRVRLHEVPVTMREREHGRSSISRARLGLLHGRRSCSRCSSASSAAASTPLEDEHVTPLQRLDRRVARVARCCCSSSSS